MSGVKADTARWHALRRAKKCELEKIANLSAAVQAADP